MGGFFAAGTLGLVAEYFLKTTAVLTLALLAAAASRRRPAAFRHFVLSFALVGLLLLPLLSLAPVGWRTTLLPARPAETRARTVLPARPYGSLERPRASDVDIRSSERQVVGVPETAPPASAADRTAKLRIERSSKPTAAVIIPFHGASSSPPLRQAADSHPHDGAAAGFPINIVLAVLWSAGLVALVLRLAVGLAGAVKLTAQGTALGDPAWRLLLERFKALVSLRCNIRLKGHPDVLVPMTWGWRKPVVLMPAGADAWTEEERSSALFHELSHVKRADFLVMLLVRTSLAAFWFNPLCWVVYRELRKEQEIACDELVLRAGIRPSTYAASLLAFRRSAGFRWNPSAALLGMLGRSSFHERLAAILKQKLTFKEVKMKTKIMLASTVVLAVAIVGTARPAVGIEKTAGTAIIVETAAPVAAAVDIALTATKTQGTQAEKAVVQEKEKEKAKAAEKAKEAEKAEKEKAVIEKIIVVTTKDGAKTPIVITITEGDEVKTLTLDKPLTITRGEGGHVLVLSSDGKDIEVLKGEPLSLMFEGGAVELLKEGKVLKVGEGGAYKIIRKGDKEGSQVVVYWTPEVRLAKGQEIRVIKEGEAAEAAPEVFVKRLKDKKEGETWVVAEPVKEAKVVAEGPGAVKVVVKKATEVEPEIVWTVKEPGKEGKEGALWVTKKFSGKPAEGAWMSKGGQAFAFSPARDKELLEKVRAIQEQVAAVKDKKLDFTALEKSLEKLEAELAANAEKLNELKIKLEKAPAEVTVAKVITRDDNTIQILLSGIEGGEGRSTYPLGVAAVDRLKKDLPEGYKILESNYDKEAGTMTFKIAPPKGKKVDEKLVRKLVDGLKEELKKK